MYRGSISVFLALMMTAVLLFMLVVTEASRYTGLRLTARQAGETAADSVFAAFDRSLLEDYGLLFYDGGRGAESIRCEQIENDFLHYFYENANKDDLLSGGSFFRVGRAEAALTEVVSAVDYNGEIFARSALAFLKYDEPGELLDRLTGDLSKVEEGDRVREDTEKKTDTGSTVGPDPAVSQRPVRKTGPGSAFGRIFAAAGVSSPVPLLRYDTKADAFIRRTESLVRILHEDEEAAGFDSERYEQEIGGSAIAAAERVRAKGWLWLALPGEKTISGKTLDKAGLPSGSLKDTRSLSDKSVLDNAADKALLNEYYLNVFSSFLSEAPEAGPEYEIEYLISGKKSDDSSLKSVLNKILLMREGLNIVYIFADSVRRQEVESLAMLLVGWTGIPALTAVTVTALVAAWAFAESIMDMRILLSGGRVPLTKGEGNWSLDLSNVIDFLAGADMSVRDNPDGMDYEDYLRLLLFSGDSHELAFRAMDLIQLRKQETIPGFTMSSQIFAMEFRTTVSAPPLFSALPFSVRHLGYGNAVYEWEEYYSEAYG